MKRMSFKRCRQGADLQGRRLRENVGNKYIMTQERKRERKKEREVKKKK